MTQQFSHLSGMQQFSLIWFAQMFSQFGTATTRFSLMIWAYQQTGQATPLALLGSSPTSSLSSSAPLLA